MKANKKKSKKSKKSLNDENTMIKSNNSKYIDSDEIILGNFEDVPKHFQQNVDIKTGYRLNCNTLYKATKSLFILHNESVNIWSHLLGAIFFIFLIWYTSHFITNYKTQFNKVELSLFEMEKDFSKLPDNIEDNLLNSLIKNFNRFNNGFKTLKSGINNLYESSFILLNDTYEKIISRINNMTTNIQIFFDSFNLKFLVLREKVLDLIELEKFNDNPNNINIPKNLERWPLFVFLVSAILCLSFSSIFHLTNVVSYNYHRILSRFDYGGICILITGSCYPPYYYFFYCEPTFRTFYLTFITVYGLTIFGLCLTDGYYMPEKRVIRGTMFLIFGICSGIPVIHISILGDKLKGYNTDTRFLFWYLGGITYIIGGILYITRYPEKIYSGKFDFFGGSHQLLHISVLIAAFFHYIACLDAYYSRFDHLC